ncbi:transposase [Bacteroides sedimenti]|uniref:Transposase IS4-like domain-containing protein n=1 Tax=Bacteroides sedimenti TaxID=2136147 RepID=A0ABM8IHM2_9BACE
MRGLEILGVGLIDADINECVLLYTVQTPDPNTLHTANWMLVDWYLFALEKEKEILLNQSKHVVADAWFAKSTFVNGLDSLGFLLISRFRDDANLMYITTAERTGKKGRPKKFDGKIDFKNLELTRFEKVEMDLEDEFYTAIVHSKALNKAVRIVIRKTQNGKSHKIYFSTDTTLSGKDVVELYRTRFQIEFCFKWIKQHLHIKTFYGTTSNAVYCQIWIAICTYILLAIAKKSLGVKENLYIFSQTIGLTLFERESINDLFNNNTNLKMQSDDNQLSLWES